MDENKTAFVSALKTALILYSREEITEMEYQRRDDGTELVVISFVGGCTKKVNITGDSCIAIMSDVYRVLV